MKHEDGTLPPADAGRLDLRVVPLSPPRDDFLAGICVALQVVTSMDCGVTWAEIVQTAGVDDLLRYAAFVEPEEWQLAGFAKYARSELHRGRPRSKRHNVELSGHEVVRSNAELGVWNEGRGL